VGEKQAQWGKHRTEVTEGKEGLRLGLKLGSGDQVAGGRETGAMGKASHGGHGGQRGVEVGAETW
jgi:hypothetical protein